jgi:hypothetical protein
MPVEPRLAHDRIYAKKVRVAPPRNHRIPTVSVGVAAIALIMLSALCVDIALRWQLFKRAATAPASAIAAPEEADTRVPAAPAIPAAPWPTGAAPSPVVLIDEMSKNDNGIDGPGLEGYWYTYSDGTGQLLPAPGSPNLAATVFAGRRAREVSGGGQEKWGAGFGFDLTRRGAKAKATGAPPVFNASAYAGIQFDVLSKATPIRLRVSFSDVDTDPRGGVCDPKSTVSATTCFGDFGIELDVAPGTWEERRVQFSQTAVPPWSSLQAAIDHGLRKDAIYSVHFSLRPNQGQMPPFDVLVANVFFFL